MGHFPSVLLLVGQHREKHDVERLDVNYTLGLQISLESTVKSPTSLLSAVAILLLLCE